MADLHGSVFDALDGAVGVAYPGCVALVRDAGAEVYHEAHGVLADWPRSAACGRPVTRSTIYDLASLTKPLATTTLAAIALSAGRLRLDDAPPQDLVPQLAGATLGHLLCHASGLPAHVPFYVEAAGVEPGVVWRGLRATAPVASPGTKVLYSDLGFMVLGAWLERVFDASLGTAFEDRVAAPLGLHDPTTDRFVGYLPLGRPLDPSLRARIAPTEHYAERPPDETVEPDYLGLRRAHGLEAWGEVHDDNAFVLGGVAGHAGLFGTAAGVADLAAAWLDGLVVGLSTEIRDRLWAPCPVPESAFRYGFDGPTAGGSTGGALSADAVGHLGFTGTSLWIEPSRRRIYVLLSNRVHPHRRRGPEIAAVRQAFHRRAAGALDG
ncbi:MAG: class A beta-lactamase-related serine hydrolase [Deltaproteobacteria bacterium]|nr:MAG: class A beta-lactamase-related serine hydrolase [Deltaproteobacteria bacterium]